MSGTRAASMRDLLAGVPRRAPAGRAGDPGRFPVGSVARRINAETRLLLGGPRALLLQLAEPRVAAGVADHSDFLDDPFARLWNTLDLTLTAGFGDGSQAAHATARVARTHAGVTGERHGIPYRALDPELLTWVHATLVDSAIVTYERFVGRIGPGARDAYVRGMNPQGAAFGIPDDRLWPDHPSFRDYVAATLERLEVGDEALRLGRAVLRPVVTVPVAPAGSLLRFVTAGLLPGPLRAAYGLRWSSGRERTFGALAATVRGGGALMPDALRRWPHARAADARLREPSTAEASP